MFLFSVFCHCTRTQSKFSRRASNLQTYVRKTTRKLKHICTIVDVDMYMYVYMYMYAQRKLPLAQCYKMVAQLCFHGWKVTCTYVCTVCTMPPREQTRVSPSYGPPNGTNASLFGNYIRTCLQQRLQVLCGLYPHVSLYTETCLQRPLYPLA